MEESRIERLRYFGFAAIVGVLLLLNLAGIWKTVFGIDTAAILTLLAGYRIFYNAISALLDRQISADLAICIAVIAALAAGEYLAAAEAMFIMLIGEGLESYAAGRTSAAIRRFVEQLPRRARLVRDGVEEDVDAAALSPGDLIEVRAGERIPADGVIVHGISSIDESTITGEPLPRDKQPGEEVFSGTLNGFGLLRIRVSRAGSDTTLARVVALIEEARERRAPVERLADRYAKYFLPAILVAAALTFYFSRDWMRTVAVLIVACPCALILATPTAMVAAIGGLARRGILVRGGTVLQEAARVNAVIFDKTGTVTEGRFEIVKMLPVASEDELLRLAATAEQGSEHVLARLIVEEARARGIRVPPAGEARVLPGRGAECFDGNQVVRAGSAGWLTEAGIYVPPEMLEEADRLGATAVFVADGERLAGAILLRDRVRAGTKAAIAGLNELGITQHVMLTGDRRRAAEAMAREIGIANVEAELLPEQKLDRVRALAGQGRAVAMVGDGINDAPALAAAHLGIAVSGATDVTAEAADAVYMPHSLDKLPKLFEVSRKAVGIAWQNIILFAGIVNVAAVLAASYGVIGPLGAAFTHQISSFFVMLNSLRLLRVEKPRREWGIRARLQTGTEWIRAHRARFARPAAYTAIALVLLNGFYIVQPDEVAVVERFGKRLRPNKQAGLHYKAPWPIERLTRVPASRVRIVEIGFRSGVPGAAGEPATYEWNVQHRSGRFQRKPEESLMLTGDQNMIELTAVVHYRLKSADQFIFEQLDPEGTVRAAAESSVHAAVTSSAIDQVLTTGRREFQSRVSAELQKRLDKYAAGVEVLAVRLLDVHPSQEVVDSFRNVSGAFEEKNRMINEAEGYRNEQVALARGNAGAAVQAANAYSKGRKTRSEGDAARFQNAEAAYRAAPAINDSRLYLETVEQVLPGKKKLIMDAKKGRRQLLMLEDGVEIPGLK
jgi:Cu+-exporting ATPase